MSYENFRKLRSSGTVVNAPENPYVKKIEKTVVTPDEGKTSVLDGQNKALYSRIFSLERELKDLKEDLASIYAMLMNPDEVGKTTPEEAREKYMNFKKDARHLLNRKVKDFSNG